MDADLLKLHAELLFDLTGDVAFRKEVFASCVLPVWQCWQLKKCRESFGAALRNARANGDVGSIKGYLVCRWEA